MTDWIKFAMYACAVVSVIFIFVFFLGFWAVGSIRISEDNLMVRGIETVVFGVASFYFAREWWHLMKIGYFEITPIEIKNIMGEIK